MYQTHELPVNEAKKAATDIVKELLKKEPMKAKFQDSPVVYMQDVSQIEKLEKMMDDLPPANLLKLFTAPILMEGYKFYRLNKNLDKAIEVAKDILKYRKPPVEVKMTVTRDGRKFETELIYLHTVNPQKVMQLKRQLVARFPDGKFSEILLLMKKIERNTVSCPNCNRSMRSNHLTRHLKTCAPGMQENCQ